MEGNEKSRLCLAKDKDRWCIIRYIEHELRIIIAWIY